VLVLLRPFIYHEIPIRDKLDCFFYALSTIVLLLLFYQTG
jgi:hypothetical protein